jgi:hypothetical protein
MYALLAAQLSNTLHDMRSLAFFVFSVMLAVLICQASPRVTAEPEVTFARDVAPILYGKCVTCHRKGEVAPMSLLTYEDARPWARAIKEKVVQRQMPPWFADPKYGTFTNDPSLSAKEIETISKWVDAGAPQGDAKDMPKPPQFTEGWQLGEPDLIVELPEVRIPATGPDYFPTPSIPLNITEDRWIRAVEIRPSNREVTHHSVIFSTAVGAGMGSSGFFDVLAVWAVGTPPIVYPEGMGRWVRKGQTLRTNLHYHPNGKPQVDRTRVGLYFGKGEMKKEVVAALAGTFTLSIPPQDPNYELRSTYIVDQDINLVSLFPHMHLRGKDMKLTATYPGGRQETLLNVPAYSFDWQLFYYPKNQMRLPKGTRIDLVAHYDNSAANKRNPDPTQTVTFGEGSTSEMMFGMFEFTAVDGVSPKPPNNQARMEALLASFPKGTAYQIDLPQLGQLLSLVLYLPQSGEAEWYISTLGFINVSPIKDLVWNGKSFQFSTTLGLGGLGGGRGGAGLGPLSVKGTKQDDGSLHGFVNLSLGRGATSAEFQAKPN